MVVAVIIVRMITTAASASAIEGWTDQFAVCKAFLIISMSRSSMSGSSLSCGTSAGGLFGWHGVERIFQIPPPARWAGRIYHNT